MAEAVQVRQGKEDQIQLAALAVTAQGRRRTQLPALGVKGEHQGTELKLFLPHSAGPWEYAGTQSLPFSPF